MADYFDRLLARYTPVATADDTGARVRVRPRLSGPFERAEALRYGPPGPDEPAPLIPSAPRADGDPYRPVGPDREVRTERHTEVRTERVPWPGGTEQRLLNAADAPAPVLRLSADPAPKARPGGAEGARAVRRGRSPAPDQPAVAPFAPAAPAPVPAAPARAAVPVVPRGSGSPAAVRGAGLGSVGRRAPRQAERVVHVQIGRLEVSAAPRSGAAAPAGRPAQRTGRPAPVLTLDDYLSRGRKRD
ncbi:hypothetical protein ABT001_30815 [Streptomyces sp. NPDC002793]|uniref:hypothetical protein n=1 Tax=Streptomyces sp. NPDC002793 TaxID=3154432 RepID=UPI00332AB43C